MSESEREIRVKKQSFQSSNISEKISFFSFIELICSYILWNLFIILI